jgi:PAS domain S-box-containing protein
MDKSLEDLKKEAHTRLNELEKEETVKENPDENIQAILHELRVHQIELELQNEELKRSQEELVLQRESYYQLFHRAPIGYALLDENGMIRKANQLLCELIDLSQCENMCNPLSKYIVEEDRSAYMSRFKAFFKKPEDKTLELRFKGREGNILYMEMRGRKEIKEHFGFFSIYEQTPMILITFNDITERKNAEKAIVNAMKAAEEANNTKSWFLANMSHELRTPLTSIIGFSEAMERGETGELNEEQRRYMGYIEESGKHLLNLINDLLDISKVEAGKMELSLEQVNMNELLKEIEHMVYPIASYKEINLNFKQEENNITFEGDMCKLKQIMLNLISNALKFTPEQGAVDVTGKSVDHKIEISIEDTGIGIPSECHEKIFDPFSQLNSSLSKDQKGTGLGLALVKKLVELHDGTIKLESEVSKGSKFTFSIPKTGKLFDEFE